LGGSRVSKCQIGQILNLFFFFLNFFVTTPLWGKCEVVTHIPKNGTWESSVTPENLEPENRTWESSVTLKNSERDCRSQNTSYWGVLYTIEKFLKCRCSKWPRMNHLDICNTSYGQKKGTSRTSSLTPDH